MAQKRKQQNPEITPVAVYLPASEVARVDAEAESESRSRSQMIRRLIIEALDARQTEPVAAK